MEFDLELPSIDQMGLGEQGIAQYVLDTQFIHYMRLKMPYKEGMLIQNTYRMSPGNIVVATPYAHYMNEGLEYVNPKYGRNGFPLMDSNGNLIGYGHYKGKRVPSGRKLTYHGGPGRGAHFVERTMVENTDDIIKDIVVELRRNK